MKSLKNFSLDDLIKSFCYDGDTNSKLLEDYEINDQSAIFVFKKHIYYIKYLPCDDIYRCYRADRYIVYAEPL